MTFNNHYLAPLAAYQAQADQLSQELQAGNEDAAWKFKWMHPRYRGKHVSTVKSADLTLADAQLVVALNYAFASWDDLVNYANAIHDDGPMLRYEDAVEAIVTGDVQVLRSLITAHPELTRARSSRSHHATLLHYLGANGVEDVRQKTPANAVEIANILLGAGAEVDALADLYDSKCTTMSMLVSSSHPAEAGLQTQLAELLAQYGASLEDVGSRWQSCLMTALNFGYLNTAKALARLGANTNHLPAAAGLGNLADIQRLLPDADDTTRQAALALATMHNQVEVVKLLLDAGVDPNRYQPEGFHSHATPLHHAAGYNYVAMVKLLVEHGARLDIKDTIYDATPLQWAVHGDKKDVVGYLNSIKL
jgi:ankyrin repeat protein